MSLSAQNPPTGKGFDKAVGNRQGIQVLGRYPTRVRGVVARAQRATGDRDDVVPDVDDRPVEEGALDPAEQLTHLDGQVRLLEHLPDQRFGVALTWLDPAAGDGP